MMYQWKFLTIRDLCKADLDFLFVCTLTTMPFRFLNPCNHMSLALNFFFSSSDSEGSSRTNFSILALRYLPSTRIPTFLESWKISLRVFSWFGNFTRDSGISRSAVTGIPLRVPLLRTSVYFAAYFRRTSSQYGEDAAYIDFRPHGVSLYTGSFNNPPSLTKIPQ